MLNFTGSKCPYCGEIFKEGDDIAVCPECGTPHHRACYKEHGRCANEARHAEGFVWSPDPDALALTGGSQVCPTCGYPNADAVTQCANCGRELGGSAGLPEQAAQRGGSGASLSPFASRPMQSGTDGGAVDPLERALWPYSFEDMRPDDEIDGFKIKEWVGYIARSAGYYIYSFKTQDKRKSKMSFTWSAVLFAPLYFLYRKVWWAAAAAWLANLVLGLPTFVSGFAASGSFLGLTLAQWQSVEPITSTALFLINMLWGVFAAWIFRKNSVRVMSRLRAEHPDEGDFEQALSRVSGPSLIAAIAIPLALATALTVITMALGVSSPETMSSLGLWP